MPRAARAAVETELDAWADLGVEGWFEGVNPWLAYHEYLGPMLAGIVGAHPGEVVCMNSLTVNLHLLFVSFYRPTSRRFKIIAEAGMFPSDRYMIETQMRWHGIDPGEALIEIAPREGEHLLRDEDLLAAVEHHADELALVFFGGVNYLTGQCFDLPALTRAAHDAGALAGFDLAHAAGNVPLSLHDWYVDFAAWCSYKYLNAGPGNCGGIFVHQRHAERFDLPRFGGWWGHDKNRRFLMEPEFQPMAGAEGWQVSCPPAVSFALHKASLEVFTEAGMPALRRKSVALTGYLETVLNDVFARDGGVDLEIITPADPDRRGCQLSVKLAGTDRSFFDAMMAAGVMGDFREPDVVRLAPVPLYNSFEDVYLAGETLSRLLRERR
jgi:kynureninase